MQHVDIWDATVSREYITRYLCEVVRGYSAVDPDVPQRRLDDIISSINKCYKVEFEDGNLLDTILMENLNYYTSEDTVDSEIDKALYIYLTLVGLKYFCDSNYSE